MPYALLDTVKLIKNLPEHHLNIGDIGAIIEIHNEQAYEVEFTDNNGKTTVMVILNPQTDFQPM